jgi:hypothetical protein
MWRIFKEMKGKLFLVLCSVIRGMLAIIQSKIFISPSHIKKSKDKIYKTVILPVVLYGCETFSLTLREERRLRVCEKRVMRRMFGPKREENGSWRKMHNDEFIACILHRISVG